MELDRNEPRKILLSQRSAQVRRERANLHKRSNENKRQPTTRLHDNGGSSGHDKTNRR